MLKHLVSNRAHNKRSPVIRAKLAWCSPLSSEFSGAWHRLAPADEGATTWRALPRTLRWPGTTARTAQWRNCPQSVMQDRQGILIKFTKIYSSFSPCNVNGTLSLMLMKFSPSSFKKNLTHISLHCAVPEFLQRMSAECLYVHDRHYITWWCGRCIAI